MRLGINSKLKFPQTRIRKRKERRVSLPTYDPLRGFLDACNTRVSKERLFRFVSSVRMLICIEG